MSNTSVYFFRAVVFLSTVILSQNIIEFVYIIHWRLLFSNSSNSTVALERVQPYESSVWCHNDSDKHKLCSFKNLCFSPLHNQFIFILSSNSTVWGIENKHDFKSLDFSSVSNHNKFMLKITLVSPNDHLLRKRVVTEEPVYLLWRFKHDNIMHVIHDDILPLFTTYSKLCVGNMKKCTNNFRLAFVDDGDNGPFREWYEVFSRSEPLSLTSLRNDSLMCFEDVRMGLLRSSVWFQYGFGTHQGPTNKSEVTKKIMNQFTEFISHNLNISPQKPRTEFTTSVLFKRELSRKIVNFEFVIKCMQETFSSIFPDHPQLKVFVLDLSVNDSKTILSILSMSKLLVGMHGAEMMMSIFLPRGSAVVELFPFGIVPSYVSPLKSLSSKTSFIIYEAWENLNENNSHPHPEAPALLGGIEHLPTAEQSRIKTILPIPAVKCCHDPAYLYRMFQDTTVGEDFFLRLQNVLTVLKKSSTQPDKHEKLMWSKWWFPGPVSNISCDFTVPKLTVIWNPPLNVDGVNVVYVLTLSIDGQITEFTTTENQLVVIPIQSIGTPVNVWIKCIAPEFNLESIDTHEACNLL